MKNRFWALALVLLAFGPIVHADVYEDQEDQQQEEQQDEQDQQQEEQEQPEQQAPQPQPNQTIINNYYYNGFNPGYNYIVPCGGCLPPPILRGGPVLAPWLGVPGGPIALPPMRRPIAPCYGGPCGAPRPMPYGVPFSQNEMPNLKANVSLKECKVEMANNATFELALYQDGGSRTVLFRDEISRSQKNALTMKKYYESAQSGICPKVFSKSKSLDI